jgi:glycerate 2-kinase
MKIVVAPQALKGSLDAGDVGLAIASGIRSVFPHAELTIVPVADGGEGTVVALVSATGGRLMRVTVRGPLGDPVEAAYGILGPLSDPYEHQEEPDAGSARTAVIEMAAASGIALVPPARRDPRLTSTYGTGELMRAALDAGCTRLIIGIGGSATNDGGSGMAAALGARLLDEDERELPPGGVALLRLARIDARHLDPRLRQAGVQVACDVSNPLTGPEGAAAVYGPQKGATPEMVKELDAALSHYARIIERDLGVEVASIPGSGAAGGLGAGLLAFTSAALVPGSRLVLDALHFARLLKDADLVITAEGSLDAQTAYGKSVAAVAAAGQRAGARVVALAGSVTADAGTLAALSIDAALPITDRPQSLEESMTRAAEQIEAAAARVMSLIAVGQSLADYAE